MRSTTGRATSNTLPLLLGLVGVGGVLLHNSCTHQLVEGVARVKSQALTELSVKPLPELSCLLGIGVDVVCEPY